MFRKTTDLQFVHLVFMRFELMLFADIYTPVGKAKAPYYGFIMLNICMKNTLLILGNMF